MDPKSKIIVFSVLAAFSIAGALYEHSLDYGVSMGFLTIGVGFIYALLPAFREYLVKEKDGFMDLKTELVVFFMLTAFGLVTALLTYDFDAGTFRRMALSAGAFGLCWALCVAEYMKRTILRH